MVHLKLKPLGVNGVFDQILNAVHLAVEVLLGQFMHAGVSLSSVAGAPRVRPAGWLGILPDILRLSTGNFP